MPETKEANELQELLESTPMPVRLALFRDLFVIMDPGRDQDDEDELVMMNRYIRLNILNVLGVVANLSPSAKRARLAKGTLKLLGQPTIPVGIGTPATQTDDDGLEYQFAVGYMAETDEVQDGEELIVRTLREAKPKSVVLLLTSKLTDAAEVLRKKTRLFTDAIRRVVIMGGVMQKDDLPLLDDEGRMIPDLTAANHDFDKDSTVYLYQMLQDLGIPMTILSRHAAVAGKVPRSIYDEMAGTGHPVGIRLQKAQKEAIEELWRRANLPAEDKTRQLPARCDKNWFCTTFCGGEGLDRSATDTMWEYIKTLNLYDPCAMVSAIPNLREYFFGPSVVEVHGVEHLVIGVSAKNHGVRNPVELAQFLRTTLVESLELSLKKRKAV